MYINKGNLFKLLYQVHLHDISDNPQNILEYINELVGDVEKSQTIKDRVVNPSNLKQIGINGGTGRH